MSEQALSAIKRINDGQRGEQPPPLLAFVHIPKTAGGALTTMFARAYSTEGIQKTGNYVSGREKTLNKVAGRPGRWESLRSRGVRVAVGHTPYGVFRDNLPADTRYMTFLREPVDRVLSHYYRHVHVPGMSDADRASRGKGRRARSLEEALVDMRMPQLCNLCTRFLCSHPTLGSLPRSAVYEAKENLRRFAFVGLQERFAESVVLLQRTLGLGLVPYFDRHVSAAGHRPAIDDLSDEERALILEYNQLDTELYGFGRGLFDQFLASAGDIGADVEQLRAVTAAAVEEHEATIQATREWLHRELPPGGSEPIASLMARAEAAGYPRAAVTAARRQLLVRKVKTAEGGWVFRRAAGASLSGVGDAKAWLERELPPGASESREALLQRGEAAGHSRAALNRARKALLVDKLKDPDGPWVWSHRAGYAE